MDDQTFNKIAKLLNNQYDQFNQRVNKLEKYITSLANKTYDRMDAVYKEVVAMRQEQSMHVGSHDRIDEELENHQESLKKLESPSTPGH